MIKDKNLFCYGCAHSAADENFPGKPSGERPCCFCIRNRTFVNSRVTKWYNGSKAVSIPMDCYHSIDMKRQIDQWMTEESLGEFRKQIVDSINQKVDEIKKHES